MNRIQLACCFLIASAFVLTGLLLTHLDGPLTPSAEAALVLSKEGFTFMTAQTNSDEEALFILDSVNERLLILKTDLGRKRIELVKNLGLRSIFGINRNTSRDTRSRKKR